MNGLTCEEVRESLPALSLNALEVDERDVIDDHLAACAACQSELAGYQEVAAALSALASTHEPPASLKLRVLTAATSPARPRAPRLRGWRIQPSVVAAAVALAIAGGAALWGLRLESELAEQRTLVASLTGRTEQYQQVVAVLRSSDFEVRRLQGTADAPNAIGRVYIDAQSGAGMIMVRSMPPLPDGRSYQLWVLGADGQRRSAGLLKWTDREGNGYALIQCPETLARWQSFGVTQEPEGGSSGPTGPRLLGGSI
ncbi:MAG: anti-sigma factor [Chloroflexi bacterium]|nr:anti-sigma factor [Chloroflexota bacterium]